MKRDLAHEGRHLYCVEFRPTGVGFERFARAIVRTNARVIGSTWNEDDTIVTSQVALDPDVVGAFRFWCVPWRMDRTEVVGQ